jgi:pseudaminic acid synthase
MKVLKRKINIDGVMLGDDEPPYIIAEISANHNGSLQEALELITLAKQNGANAVKIQSYTADSITLPSQNPPFLLNSGPWKGKTLYDLYAEAQTPFEWHPELYAHAKTQGITLFSSPFDKVAVDLLESLNTPAYKIASFEIVDIPLIKYIASKKKPIIMSTGMASDEEISDAITAIHTQNNNEIILLHCISGYPTPLVEANMNRIVNLRKQYNLHVGLSDHTLGNTATIVAITLGARVIEKHFNKSRINKGPDSEFSIEPNELREMSSVAEQTWKSLGDGQQCVQESEKVNIINRRSLFAVEDIKKGQRFTEQNIRSIRPSAGLLPKYYESVLSEVAEIDIKKGTPLAWAHVKQRKY